MAQNWYDKNDIKDQFGWSFKQFKSRLSNLEVFLKDHYQGGNGKAYKVDNYALELLRRQYELELEGYEVSEASRMVIQEQDNRDVKGDRGNGKVEQSELKAKVKYLERENNLLRERLEKQDNQIERLNDRMDNLLPVPPEQEKPEATPWQLLKNWLFKPR